MINNSHDAILALRLRYTKNKTHGIMSKAGSRRLQELQQARSMCCPAFDMLVYREGRNILLNCGLHLGPPYTFFQSHIGLFSPHVAAQCGVM